AFNRRLARLAIATNAQIPHESPNLRTPVQALAQSSGLCQRYWTNTVPCVDRKRAYTVGGCFREKVGRASHFFFGGAEGITVKRLPEELSEKLAALVASEGMELLAVEFAGTARKPIVRLVIDRQEGVSLDDCALISEQASVLFDVFDPFPGPYTLEVSSPGMERKFYRREDYERFAGQAVRVRMGPTWAGAKVIEGYLEGLETGVVRVRDPQGVVHLLPEREILETRLAPFAEEAWRGRPKGRGKKP
ncbi:MAG: ribosome maturation factor RimP, partial [Thermoanaerobaculum sp.]